MNHFDLLAPIYDSLAGKPDTTRFKRLLALPCKGLLLDAGGGTARVSSRLSSLVEHIVVSDLSYRMLRQASHKPVLLVGSRVEQLPFADESFDRILVVDALHHFSDQQGAIRDLLRVLKCGGRLVIEEYDLTHTGVKLLALAEKILGMGSRFLKSADMEKMISLDGVSVTIERPNCFTTWIIADKK